MTKTITSEDNIAMSELQRINDNCEYTYLIVLRGKKKLSGTVVRTTDITPDNMEKLTEGYTEVILTNEHPKTVMRKKNMKEGEAEMSIRSRICIYKEAIDHLTYKLGKCKRYPEGLEYLYPEGQA